MLRESRMAFVDHTHVPGNTQVDIPKGWIIFGMAVGSWGIFIGAGLGIVHLAQQMLG